MTTLKVNLSPALQSTLGEPGVWASAVYFEDGKDPVWTPLIDNGAVASSGTVDILLPEPFQGGKIYFLIQSRDPSGPSDPSDPQDLETVIAKESDINFGNAETNDFRYDSFEVTLQDSPNDQGNLTSVNSFGLPMQLSVTYSDGTVSTRGYNISGTDLYDGLGQIGNDPMIYTYGSGPLRGENRAAISPSEAVAQVPANGTFVASDWNDYIASLQVPDTGVDLAGFFNGAADANGVYHNAGFYSYTLEWDDGESAFWLSPTDSSEIQGYIKITPDDLANSIYSTIGDVGIYTNKTDSDPYRILNNSDFATGPNSMNTGENNQWGAVLANFLTGFTGGFYGTAGTSPNPLVSDEIDLNDNWNWDPTYAFGRNLAGDPAIFQDAYSEIFYFNTNSYGSGYSDNLMRQYSEGGPLIDVSNPPGSPDAGQNVSEINLTLYDDGETPEGYLQPVIYNYLAPDGSEYDPVGDAASANSVKLNLANANMVVEDGTAVSIDLITGWTAGGDPIWQNVVFDTSGGASLWQTWQLTRNADGSWSAVAQNDDQGSGQLLITNFPTADAGVYWYRLNVGDGASQKTYNLYVETSGPSPSQFLNPNFGSQQGSLAIDGQATIAPPATDDATIPTFTINFLYGATNTVDPSLLVRDPTKSSNGTPNAPVAGTLDGGVFTALDGQTNQVTNSITTNAAEIAFGWTGLNTVATGTDAWISGYTNKIGPLNFAQINFEQAGAPALTPISAQADIDGQWVTDAHQLGNGTYTVTMSEYLRSDPSLATPVGFKSSELTLEVDVAELGLTAVSGGEALALVEAGPFDPSGNWISLQMLHAPILKGTPFAPSVAPGTAILLYVTDDDGNLVSSDGEKTGAGVILEDATIATLGSARNDDGGVLLHGEHHVYLPTGLHLQFAVLSGDQIVDADPEVKIAALGEGRAYVNIDGFGVRVETENDLSDDAQLAGAQRVHDTELVYLEHGATVDIEASGSSGNINTLGFVRMDLDPATGEWSVAGVAYGNTDAFKDAVRTNLDGGFLMTRGGEFDETLSWTVEGESGFYAPVLLTPGGYTLIVGDANQGDNEHIRTYGQNTFGFEDATEEQGSDFDFNDVVIRILPEDDDGSPSAGLGSPIVNLLRTAGEWIDHNWGDPDSWSDIFDFGWLSGTPGFGAGTEAGFIQDWVLLGGGASSDGRDGLSAQFAAAAQSGGLSPQDVVAAISDVGDQFSWRGFDDVI